MANDTDSSLGSSLLIFLLGAAVGATVAILYAPAAGEETRQQIAAKAGEIKDKAGEIKNQIADKAGEWKDKATSMIQNAAERGSDTMEAAQDSARRVADTVKSEASNVGNAASGS